MRILFAEDDDSIRMIAKIVLEQIGHHQVVCAVNGLQAFELGKQGGFDLILLDEMMPEINGLTVSQKLKAHWATHQLTGATIIFLSAKSQDGDIEDFNKWGQGFISKPFDPRTLCAQINAILGRSAV